MQRCRPAATFGMASNPVCDSPLEPPPPGCRRYANFLFASIAIADDDDRTYICIYWDALHTLCAAYAVCQNGVLSNALHVNFVRFAAHMIYDVAILTCGK